MQLNDKRILVLGAGGLLGSQVTLSLLEFGANVIAADIEVQKMVEKLQLIGIAKDRIDVEFVRLDITQEAEVENFFSSNELMLDGGVNCTYPRNKNYGADLMDVSLEDFNENLSLHLGSAFLFAQQSAKYFIRVKRPFSLVNLASIYGVCAPKFDIYQGTQMTMPVEYAAIKSAIIQLNKYLARYVCNSEYRINSVSPGGIYDSQSEEFCHSYASHCLGKGMLDTVDLVGAITFLLSDSSKYINGQNIVVDDGFSL